MSLPGVKELQFIISAKVGVVTGLVQKPADAKALLVLAHGAGAGMWHKFMNDTAAGLAERGVATFRYNFPYMEKRIKRPDSEAVMLETVRAAVATAHKIADGLPLFAGGKSMGGRMTSLAAAQAPLAGVAGLVYLGFPLHAMGKPGAERGDHLSQIAVPQLFLQGSRDGLADLKLLKPLCKKLGKQTELFIVEGGDHSFHMLKSARKTDEQALLAVIDMAAKWMLKK